MSGYINCILNYFCTKKCLDSANFQHVGEVLGVKSNVKTSQMVTWDLT